MYESREHPDVPFGLGSCVVIACVGLSCTPVALGGELAGGGGSSPESISEDEQAIVATAVRVENHPTKAALPAPDSPDDRGRLAFVTSDTSEPLGFWGVTNGDRWATLGQDVYNVVAYGADPAANGVDDHQAIMAAINAAAARRGGVVYFPRGDYEISQSIVLPRSYTKPLVLQGEGRYVSLITTIVGAPLPAGAPVIDFDPSQSIPSTFYAFRDLQISRRNDGLVFRHAQTSLDARLREAVFERVIFIAALPHGEAPSTDLVHIQGGLLCAMNDVSFDGGRTGLVIEDSSHMSIRDSGTLVDHRSTNGIRLVGGGSHSLYHNRIEAQDGGTALGIEGGTTGIGNIQIDGLFGEGKRTRIFIKLEGTPLAPVKNVVMKDIHVPTPWGPAFGVTAPSYGLYMNDHVRNIRVLSGTLSAWGTNLTQNGGQLIHVEDGARNIQIRMATDNPIEQGGIDDYVGVEAGATRVHVELIDGLFRPYLRAEGMIDTWTIVGETAYVGASETVRATPNGPIDTILQAHTGAQDTPPQAGQRVTILGATGTPPAPELVSGEGNLRLSTLKFHLCEGAVIQLVYDGANWQEVSRSVNQSQ